MGFSQLWQKLLSRGDSTKVTPLPPYHAVSVAATLECCAAARATTEHPILSRSAPRLPLPGCTMRSECRCRFRKRSDRRSGERRFFGGAGQNQWSLKGIDKRKRQERRSDST